MYRFYVLEGKEGAFADFRPSTYIHLGPLWLGRWDFPGRNVGAPSPPLPWHSSSSSSAEGHLFLNREVFGRRYVVSWELLLDEPSPGLLAGSPGRSSGEQGLQPVPWQGLPPLPRWEADNLAFRLVRRLFTCLLSQPAVAAPWCGRAV